MNKKDYFHQNMINIKSLDLPFSMVQIKFVGLYLLSFTIPLLLHQQLITGSIVNALLFYVASKKYTFKEILPIVLLPSVAAVINGLLFGSLTTFLVYLMPFIWLGNMSLVYVYRVLKSQTILKIVGASLIKALILSFTIGVFFHFNIVPFRLVKAMSMLQLVTALLGGVLSLIFKR